MRSDGRPHASKPRLNRALRLLGLLLGVGVLAWLVAHADLDALVGVFPRIDWGFLAILAVRAATILIGRPSRLWRRCAGSAKRSTQLARGADRRRRRARPLAAAASDGAGTRCRFGCGWFLRDACRGNSVHHPRLCAAGLARWRCNLVAGRGQRRVAGGFRLVQLGVHGCARTASPSAYSRRMRRWYGSRRSGRALAPVASGAARYRYVRKMEIPIR